MIREPSVTMRCHVRFAQKIESLARSLPRGEDTIKTIRSATGDHVFFGLHCPRVDQSNGHIGYYLFRTTCLLTWFVQWQNGRWRTELSAFEQPDQFRSD